MQNMEQLHAYNCHRNVTELGATEIMLHTGWSSTGCMRVVSLVPRLAGRGDVEIAWTDDSTLAIFFYLRYR